MLDSIGEKFEKNLESRVCVSPPLFENVHCCFAYSSIAVALLSVLLFRHPLSTNTSQRHTTTITNIWTQKTYAYKKQPITIQTTIAVEFKPTGSGGNYELQWKRVEQKQWKDAASTAVQVADGNKKTKTEAYDLEPGSTYCVRLVCNGEPGPELIIDTEQVGCTPKAEKSCCVIS